MYIIICIFKIQACSLVTDVDCSELHVAMETVQAYLKVASKGQFERYTVRNLQKFASVPECKAIFAGKLFGRTKSCHQPFVHCRVHECRTHKVQISKQTNNASERLSKCKSVNSSDVSQQYHWFVSFMVCGLLPTTFFQSGIYYQEVCTHLLGGYWCWYFYLQQSEVHLSVEWGFKVGGSYLFRWLISYTIMFLFIYQLTYFLSNYKTLNWSPRFLIFTLRRLRHSLANI